jgi:hypothetical protein
MLLVSVTAVKQGIGLRSQSYATIYCARFTMLNLRAGVTIRDNARCVTQTLSFATKVLRSPR